MHNKPHSEESKKRMADAKRGIALSAQTKQRISKSCRGKTLSLEHRRKISISRKNAIFSKEHRWNLGTANLKPPNPRARKLKVYVQLRLKLRPTKEDTRKKISEALKGRPKSEEWRARLSHALRGRKHSAERIGAIVSGVIASRKKPREMSNPEKRMWDVLQSMYGARCNPYIYTGARKFWVSLPGSSFRNPDFTSHHARKIIEVFGRYWHRGDDTESIVASYKQAGWDCLILWEDELDSDCIDRIMEFTYPYEYRYELERINKVA